jgi:hypothetical protein
LGWARGAAATVSRNQGAAKCRKINIFNNKNNFLCSTTFLINDTNKNFNKVLGYVRAQLVKALCYKLKDLGFDS